MLAIVASLFHLVPPVFMAGVNRLSKSAENFSEYFSPAAPLPLSGNGCVKNRQRVHRTVGEKPFSVDQPPNRDVCLDMAIEHHPLIDEFPEDHEAIHHLKTENAHFRKLMDEYEAVDKEVYRMEEGIETPEDAVLNEEKKKRLDLKDQIAAMIRNGTP